MKYTLLLIMACTFHLSCSTTTRLHRAVQKPARSAGTFSMPAPDLLRPGDQLEMRNLQHWNLVAGELGAGNVTTAAYTINGDGLVTLPVLGRVKLAGLTKTEAEDRIAEEYRRSLLVDPIIDLTITNAHVTLLGEFIHPGNFQLTHEQTAFAEILGEAGGFSARADQRHIFILRENVNGHQLLSIDLPPVASAPGPGPMLSNGDLIYARSKPVFSFLERSGAAGAIIQQVLLLGNLILLLYTLSR